MKKYKRHIIIGSIIIAVLVFAFWWGGDAPSLRGWNVEPTPKVTERVIIDEVYDNDESPTPVSYTHLQRKTALQKQKWQRF